VWNAVKSLSPLFWVCMICASGWLYGYRYLLLYENHLKVGTDEFEYRRRVLAGMRIFATALVTFFALRCLT
jgi:hypothetical protein